MANWLVRTDAPSISFDGKFEEFFIRSRRKPRIGVGDTILFLKSASGELFENFAKVTGLRQAEMADDMGIASTAFSVSKIKGASPGVDIDSLKFSLTFVRNLTNPKLHFRRGYRSVSAQDLRTIESGEAFLARTAYYELLGSLPETLRASFEADEIIGAAQMGGLSNEYRYRLERLNEFIEIRILSVGQMLGEINESLDLLNFNDDFEHCFVANDTDMRTRADSLTVQVDRFGHLNDALNTPLSADARLEKTNVIQQLIQELDRQERKTSESRFEREFRGGK
ncbi:hypothetical protein MCEZEM1_00068 [Comamonadaceae bacterium]